MALPSLLLSFSRMASKTGSMILLMAATTFAPVARAGPTPGQVVDRLFDAYRDGSAEGMLAVYAADATFEDINQRHRFTGTEQLQAMLAGIVGLHLRMDLDEKRRVVDGHMVVVEYEYRGQLNGAALGASVGKQGCPDLDYVLQTTSWYEVQKGKIVHQKDFTDWATFLDLRQQLLAGGAPSTEDGSR